MFDLFRRVFVKRKAAPALFGAGAVLELAFIDETGVFPADFRPAFVTVKLVYSLSTQVFRFIAGLKIIAKIRRFR
jgi:hypothetical protein